MLPVLLARWGQRRFGLSAQDIDETLLCPKLTPPPLQSKVIEGYFRYNEEWIPVVAASTLLSEEQREVGLYDVLVLSHSPRRWALRVHQAEGLTRVDWQEIAPSTSFQGKMPGLLGDMTLDESVLPVFVLPQVLLGLEKELMDRFDRVMKERESDADQALKEHASE